MTGDISSLFASLCTGQLDEKVLGAFPEPDVADRVEGDGWVVKTEEFARRFVSSAELDRTGHAPAELIDALRREGFLSIAFGEELGGAGLTPYDVFRVVSAISAHSTTVGQIVAVQAGLGVGALYPALPEGPMRELVRDRIRGGALSGFADTDAAGQNNRLPQLTATPNDDGTVVLRGTKLFIANGPVADLLAVSAVLDGQPCVCVVDTTADGFTVRSTIEFIGSKGLPSGALVFDDVRVPAEHVLSGSGGGLKLPPLISSLGLLGRVYFNGAPASGIVRNCLAWSRDFVTRRRVDGRGLGEYDRIQRMVSDTMADAYAMDCLARWCLVGSGTERWMELFLAKNVLSMTAWRAADRTVSLLGAEGLETADSKRRRGAAPLPVEQALRDARVLRTAGNVDFQLDIQLARLLLASPQRGDHAVAVAPADIRLTLSSRNQTHLTAISEQTHRFATRYDDAARRYTAPIEDEAFLVTFGRIAAELVTACAVLSRTSLLGTNEAQNLADVHCTRARRRLASLWDALACDEEPDYGEISRGWLADSTFDFLTAP